MTKIEKLRIIWISVYKAVRTRGWQSTIAMILVALKDEREDRKKGVIAHMFLDPQRSDPHANHVAHANYYQPVRSAPFRRLLSELRPRTQDGFVDIGAGTGKAMLLAAEYGFKNVRGVELAKQLCELAEENFRKFQNDFPSTRFQIVHADALSFTLEDNDRFLFLNDPFSEEVFRPFLERVLALKNKVGQPITLVYKNNNRRQMPSLKELEKSARFFERDIRGNLFQIYEI